MAINKQKILFVLPVYNEEMILKENVLKLYNFLKTNIRDNWQIIVADNKSTDRTGEIGKQLAQTYDEIKYSYIPQNGKGKAIRSAWVNNTADIFSFMDVDLSTDLSALPALISAISEEKYDVAVGSRFLPNSKVYRSFLRKFISLGYRFILHLLLNLKTKDVPCGFKAANYKVVRNLVPQIKNDEWFFDSELVILAEKNKYKIKEIPIKWTESQNPNRKSKINIFKTSFNYLKEIIKCKESRTFLKFLAVGFSGFLINALGLRVLVENFFLPPSLANMIAAEVAIVSNFIWNNAWTFNQEKIKNPLKIFYKFFLFNITTSLGVILVQTGTIQLGVVLFGKSLYMFYFLIGTALLLIWNFTIYNRFIWRHEKISD